MNLNMSYESPMQYKLQYRTGNHYGHSQTQRDMQPHTYGGYTRKHPKALHTPPLQMWTPPQSNDPYKAEYGNEFNNPQPIIHHHIAARSSGRVLRFPALNEVEKAWGDNMLTDGMRMFVTPDPTLTGTLSSAATTPTQLSGIFWQPYNDKDQLGWRV